MSCRQAAERFEHEATSKSVAFNVQEAAVRTTQVAASAGEVTNRAIETGGTSMQVLMSAELLSEKSSRLKHELGSFVAGFKLLRLACQR
ncbi:hypothetical protein [Bradyrhizobium brasilense]|uniref:hypothetical protein n=1 Tax=Bradyrhizobium brasilense TaxID=1419277 RepID=UPI002877B78C|nr:hypothetical protein [Bradyrhizobium brasilense]